jgi:hypothetical protein
METPWLKIFLSIALGLAMGGLVYAVSLGLHTRAVWPGTFVAFGLGFINGALFIFKSVQ